MVMLFVLLQFVFLVHFTVATVGGLTPIPIPPLRAP